jgi:hypothetical protein
MKKHLLVAITSILVIFLFSCNNLPPDLKARIDTINEKFTKIKEREKTIHNSIPEYQKLVNDYTSLRDELIKYKDDANSRDISIDDDALMIQLDNKITEFQGMIPEIVHVRDWKSFDSGGWWEKQKENKDSETLLSNQQNNNSSQANQSSPRQIQQQTHYASDGQRCSHCGLGHYRNGYCDMCGAASPEIVVQSLLNAPACDMCKGTGYIHAMNGDLVVCPACNGTGKETY